MKYFHPLVIAALLLSARTAAAYPQFIGKGYTNCATCHYSPTGGGFANSYGHAVSEATLPDTLHLGFLAKARDALMKNNVTGYDDDGHAAFQWDVGLEARLLFIPVPLKTAAKPQIATIPMMAEIGGVVAYGPLTAYASVTPRRTGAKPVLNSVFSREHWLQYRINPSTSVRIGRMELPFGLRVPDHTQYTREDLGFNKWSQSYAIELDHYTEHWMNSLAVYAGDLWNDPPQMQQRGVAASITYNVPSRAALGFSVLGGTSTLKEHVATGVNLRWRIWKRIYGMGELSGYFNASRRTSLQQWGAAALGRLGWFALESLDLYFEWGGRSILHHFNLTKLRYEFGANWQILPWVELDPVVLLEEDTETGLSTTVYGQVHIIY